MTMDIRIDGIGSVKSGNYNKVKIDGVGKVVEDITFERMTIDGTCTCEGKLEGKSLDVNGMVKVKADVKVSDIDINGMMRCGNTKLYADEIHVQGMLKNEGEVNADKVYVEGCVNLNDLFGDEITMNYDMHMFHILSFARFNFVKMNKMNNIECSTLRASYMKAHSISASDIILTNHCEVDVIYCDGVLKFDNSCKIGRIEGDCTQNKDSK